MNEVSAFGVSKGLNSALKGPAKQYRKTLRMPDGLSVDDQARILQWHKGKQAAEKYQTSKVHGMRAIRNAIDGGPVKARKESFEASKTYQRIGDMYKQRGQRMKEIRGNSSKPEIPSQPITKSAFGVIHKKFYPPGTPHRFLWRADKVAPQYGGTKKVKPGRTAPNPNSQRSADKAAKEWEKGSGKVQPSGAVLSSPQTKATMQGAKTARVVANTNTPAGKALALKQGDKIGGDAYGTMRYAGSDVRTIRAKKGRP